MKNKFHILPAIIVFISFTLKSQTLLEANGPGNTYELINSIFAPNGGNVVETPDCAHPEFGRHIAEVWDEDLQKYVFEFYIHVTPDNDRCINFDRQRVEIKTYEPSPENLKGTSGETVVYKWFFKIPTGFQPSSNFTHLHQIKPVGGDEDTPIFALTARKGNPNRLELNYYESSNQSAIKLKTIYLSWLENSWVEVTERIKIDPENGNYAITIKRINDGIVLLDYENQHLLTIRPDNNFIRPKWGIYRSLLSSQDLRDESVRFADFSIEEVNSTALNKTILENSNFSFFNDSKNKKLKVNFTLNQPSDVAFSCMLLNGQRAKEFSSYKNLPVGEHQAYLDFGNMLPGIYLLSMKTSYGVISKKMLIQP
ncbi:MAG TPA: hypothetical protein P5157_08315 [Paludibacteraceae bacterium]|nr:hypothetical protein [Paludibacteraceae bacterium]HRS24880.1 hypothetical protein [Paludibacteraceae bacterium]